MQVYNPFGKALDDVVASDLGVLRGVKEGWYVEYKREVPNAKSIAKSISALANTYGGWIFYGVEEASKEEPVAGGFPGIRNAGLDSAIQTIRNSVSTCLSDSPHYELKALSGPGDTIGLAADVSVICIHVPRGIRAPFVHNSGQIFRRVADCSDPRPETDRHMLSELWRRRDDLDASCKKFVKRDPEFSKGEDETPFIRLMLAPDLFREYDLETHLTLEDARTLFGVTPDKPTLGHLPFDAVHEHASGFRARQSNGNDPLRLGLNWSYSHGAISDIIIPLSWYRERPEVLEFHLDGYKGARTFSEALIDKGYDEPDVVDLNFVFSAIGSIVDQHHRLLERATWTKGYHAKIRLLNCWRKIPFLDTDDYLQECMIHGPPIVPTNVVTNPQGEDLDSFCWIERGDGSDLSSDLIQQALKLFVLCLQAFGVTVRKSSSELANIAEAWGAGERAKRNQELRMEDRR